MYYCSHNRRVVKMLKKICTISPHLKTYYNESKMAFTVNQRFKFDLNILTKNLRQNFEGSFRKINGF